MHVPGHVDMTRDAVLLTAEGVRQENDDRLAYLATCGVGVSPDVLTERRVQALVEMVLPDEDQRALLELAYQEKLREWLHSEPIDDAIRQARQARLLAPPGAFSAAANGHPH